MAIVRWSRHSGGETPPFHGYAVLGGREYYLKGLGGDRIEVGIVIYNIIGIRGWARHGIRVVVMNRVFMSLLVLSFALTADAQGGSEVVEMTPPEEVVALIESVTAEEAFNLIATLDGFEKVDNAYEFFEFPVEIGTPTMIAHGNAMHRDEILWFMDRLTGSSLVFDDTDEKGRFDRFFLEEGSNDLLYVHVGINGNDTVLILFQGGERGEIDKFLEKLKAE